MASKLLMMNFHVCHRTAELAPPTVAPEYLLAKFIVGSGLKLHSRLLRSNVAHEALAKMDSRNVCFCASGSSPKNLFIENSRVSGSP